MSKFHVGDRVRVHLPSETAWDGKTGVVEDLYPAIHDTNYYDVVLDESGVHAGFTEAELRPADIFAQEKENDFAVYDTYTPEGVLQGSTQGVPSGEEAETRRVEGLDRVSELSGERPGLPGLSPQGPGDKDNDDLSSVLGDVGVAQDSAGNRVVRGAVRELPQEGTRGSATSGFHPVTRPAHYNRFPVEVINITEQLDFNRGNAVKYLARAGFKEGVDELEDLSKAAWYVNRAIEKLTKERESNG